jgi:hypothetical protein
MLQKYTCEAHPMYSELYKSNSRESTFVEFCVDEINFRSSIPVLSKEILLKFSWFMLYYSLTLKKKLH